MKLPLRLLAIALCAVSGCARFEPRVSVETTPVRPSRTVAPAAATRPEAAAEDAYSVARGDTLYGIAFRHRVDMRDLAAWNNIAAPYTIYPGQTLRLAPANRSTRFDRDAPRPAPPATQGSTAARPTVAAPPDANAARLPNSSGDTQTFAIRDETLATPTAVVSSPSPVQSPPVRQAPAAAEASPATPATPGAPLGPIVAGSGPMLTGKLVAEPEQAPRAVVDANAMTRDRDGLRWRWPLDGRVIGRFVDGDPTQQGIDIGGSLGHVVVAASAGEVVYSGNGLLGYGELVIVQHSAAFLSAYGHNQRRLVSEGTRVVAGQPIAEMGRRGGIDMLHFEIRRNGKPVDPLAYLPQR